MCMKMFFLFLYLTVKMDLVEVVYYLKQIFHCYMIRVLHRHRHYFTFPYYYRKLYN